MSCYIRATVSVLLIIEPWTICKLSTSSPVRFSVKRLLACWKKRFIVFKLLLLLCDSLQFFWVLFYNYHVSVTSHSLGTQHFPQYVSCSKDGRQLCTSTMSGIIIIIVRFSPVLLGLVCNCHVSATSRSLETQHFPQYVSCSKDGRQLCNFQRCQKCLTFHAGIIIVIIIVIIIIIIIIIVIIIIIIIIMYYISLRQFVLCNF